MNKPLLSIILLLTLCSGRVSAQDDNTGDVVIHSDARLAVLLRKTHSYVKLTTPEPIAKIIETPSKPVINNTITGPSGLIHSGTKVMYNGKGYRVQIYNGPSRDKAIAVKTGFMRRFPGVSTYLVYVSPGFRVKIGDYRSRSDAEGMLREANSMFSPSMIVPDMVSISTN
jgi:hypothetical protein